MVPTGYLDDVLAVFDRHNHRFVLLEEDALGWMGVAELGRQNHTNVLVHNSQKTSIVNALVDLGRWEVVERSPSSHGLDPPEGVPLLKGSNADDEPCFLSLWTESDYHLSVDGGTMIEVPDCRAHNDVLIQKEFHPDREKLRYGPRLLTSKGIQFVSSRPARSGKQMTPIFIPTIPALLDALLDQARYLKENFPDHSSCYRPLIHVGNMIRYLHLEEPHQKEALLPKLALRNQDYIIERLRRYKRKQTVGMVGGELRTISKGNAMLSFSI